MSSLVLARKWRPHTFDTVTGQTAVIQTLIHALTLQRLHHAYLFTGTRGVGKTTIARILAKALSCEVGITATPCGKCLNCQEIDAGRFVDLIEIDAASRSKVEDTRDFLDNVPYAPTRGRFKIYLIDEVHMLSQHSFNALLKTLEEPPEHVKFLLATTDPKKLPITVLSRCLQFHLKNMLPDEVEQQLAHILQNEGIDFEGSALPWIAQAADGSLRDALSLLEQAIVYTHNQETAPCVKEKDVIQMLGYVETIYMTQLIDALIAKDAESVLSLCEELKHQGADCLHILQSLQNLFHQLTILQLVPHALPTASEKQKQLATQISSEDIQLFYQIALKGAEDLALAPTPWIALEMILLRMLIFRPVTVSGGAYSTPVEKKAEKLPPPLAPLVKGADEQSESGDFIGTANQEIPLQKIPPSPPLKRGEGSKEEIENWETLLPQLQLTGMANTVAQHCSLAENTERAIVLNISNKQATLLTESIKKQIEEALQKYFIHEKITPKTISFQVVQETLDSPAAKQQAHQTLQEEKAKASFKKDKNFQKILDTFHGTIVPGSIQYNDEVNEE